MYHTIVRHRTKDIFDRLSAGDWKSVAAEAPPAIHHVFPGSHALGGERHSQESLVRWFERMYRLFPDLEFKVLRMASGGWPWDTWVAVEWTDRATLPNGELYRNEGAHWIQLRWGRPRQIHAYLDTERVEEACRRLAASGLAEAVADPIVD